ncbi:Ketosteroid isomerase homolog [Kaistella treverensis]|uniref:Ketosteroid isomerase homolog n=1 Tax=Kaistella treverensis TaxID=631455 RepID=A0A1I3KFL9_9FLAO|nr:nuclear transport factor 2 family protein [Kaistella treverensis]SFI71296.1 Ketosteroid isomerase homolog [Kaistella treverensis]
MEKLHNLIAFILIITFSTAANAQSEIENVKKLNSAFDKASLSGDLQFFENTLAPDFVSYQPDGSKVTRAQVLERIKMEKEKPSYKLLNVRSEDVNVKMDGNLAFVTGLWNSSTSGLEADASPHNDTGFYTAAFENRDGKWMLISDHSTEKAHTPEELMPSLQIASNDFEKAIATQDSKLFDSLLSDEFTSVNENGKMRSKAEEIAQFKSPELKITSVKSEEKKFRIHRSTAVETGVFNVSGTFKGKPFTEKGRYTSTWFYHNGKWVLASDHTSLIN